MKIEVKITDEDGNVQQYDVSGALPHPCVDPLFDIKGCDMPKGSCSACGGTER